MPLSASYSLFGNGVSKRGEAPLLIPPPLKQGIFRAQLMNPFERGIKGVSFERQQY
jgi:hypothetical protein